jgi:hypothetical protein
MHELTPAPKRDFKTRIIRFLTEVEPAPLTSDEETVLARWESADRLMREKRTDEFIINHLKVTYGVSTTTAHNDLYSAMDVFGKARKLNKSYLLHHHLGRIDQMIEKIRRKWEEKSEGDKEYYPTEKEIAAVARLNDAYTYALNSMPEQRDRASMPPPVMIFKGIKGTTVATGMSVEDALTYADEIINGKLPDDDSGPTTD